MDSKTFADIKQISDGLVLLGCGGDLSEWETGVTNLLKENGIAGDKPLFDPAFTVTTTGGRTDIVMPFAEGNTLNMGKLAIWRLHFGDCSWLSDYIVNYASHHGYGR